MTAPRVGNGMTDTYAELAAKSITAPNGIDFAYRDLGTGPVALVLLQHSRGNLDNWDPALINSLAAHRRVIAFDNAGVASTTGVTPPTTEEMARDALAFIDAMELDRFDLLGFSIGSFVAQEIALTRPSRQAGSDVAARIFGRAVNRDVPTNWATRVVGHTGQAWIVAQPRRAG